MHTVYMTPEVLKYLKNRGRDSKTYGDLFKNLIEKNVISSYQFRDYIDSCEMTSEQYTKMILSL